MHLGGVREEDLRERPIHRKAIPSAKITRVKVEMKLTIL